MLGFQKVEAAQAFGASSDNLLVRMQCPARQVLGFSLAAFLTMPG